MKLFILFGSIQAWQVDVKVNAVSPNVIHDKCDETIFGPSFICELSEHITEPHLECFEDCGVNMYQCDCNIYSNSFTWFDNAACKWKAVQNTKCSLDSETTTTIVTSSTTTTTEEPTTTTTTKEITTTTTAIESPTTTTIPAPVPTTSTTTKAPMSPSVTLSTTSTTSSPSVTTITSTPITTSTTSTPNNDPDSKVYEMKFPETEISEEPRLEHDSRSILTYPQIYQPGPTRCDNVAADWNCSSGQSQHSVCIRQCSTDYHSEAIKCKCKHQVCRWEQKGKACTRTSLFNQDSMRADVPLSKPFPFSQPPLSQGLQTGAQTVFGETFLGNDDEEHKIVQPHVINLTPGGPRAQRGMSAGTPGNAESDQNSFPQFLRDINLSNMGQMIFNVNYFNSYASTISPNTL